MNPSGDAALVVQAMPPQAGTNHDEIIRNAVKPNSGNVERSTLNGFQATHFTGTRLNAQGQSQPIELTIVTGPSDHLYVFLYAAKDRTVVAAGTSPDARGRVFIPRADRSRSQSRASIGTEDRPLSTRRLRGTGEAIAVDQCGAAVEAAERGLWRRKCEPGQLVKVVT